MLPRVVEQGLRRVMFRRYFLRGESSHANVKLDCMTTVVASGRDAKRQRAVSMQDGANAKTPRWPLRRRREEEKD